MKIIFNKCVFSFLLLLKISFLFGLKEYQAIVIKKIPHYSPNFTQGLVFDKGFLYESTGLYGESSLKKIDPSNGKVLKIGYVNDQYFCEGLAILDEKIVQLTWKSKKGFVYRLSDFSFLKTISYNKEGWGLTLGANEWIMSDGSHYLFFRDLKNFKISRRIAIFYNHQVLQRINELEYVGGFIYANIWQESWIAKIDVKRKKLIAKIDCSSLVLKSGFKNHRENVLNGIAYNLTKNSFYITGKKWPYIYEVVFKMK